MTDGTVEARPRLTPGLVFSVLVPFGFGYFLSYLYRAVNAVTAPDLVRDIGLSATELGFLTAAYLLAFAGFQVPLGVLLDRFGPRRVQAVLMALTGLGALIFATAGSQWGLSAGRALIGIGCAGGLMAGFKAVVLWVGEERRALANAIVMALGGLGVFAATLPANYAIEALGWRGMFIGLVVLSVGVSLLILVVVPETPARQAERWGRQFRVVGSIYTDPVFWRIAPLVALTVGVHIAIQTLWAGPWLRDVAGLSRDAVAAHLAIMAIGFLIGTLIVGGLADWLGRRGIGLLHVMLGYISVFLLVEVAVVLEWTAAAGVLWLVFGMLGQSGVLAFPWLARYFGVALAGRASTALNFVIFSTAFLAQYGIGAIIDLWPATAEGTYQPQAYQAAFGAFVGLQVLALLWYLLKAPDQKATAAIR